MSKDSNATEEISDSIHQHDAVGSVGNLISTSHGLKSHLSDKLLVSKMSIFACLFSTLLLRIASRTSFVVLGFYLGENFESATLVVVVIEAFYVSELLVAPMVGSLTDRKGRKPFLLYTPVVGSVAALLMAIAAFLFPRPDASALNGELIALLLIVLVGRLLEGVATALNTPASLGYLTDATIGSEKLRARVVTWFEIVTVGGLALAIPFGGQVSRFLGTGGFFVVIALQALIFLTVYFLMQESLSREELAGSHGSLGESLVVLRDKRIFTFIPAWLAVNALVGGWISLITIMLAYPTPNAGGTFDPALFPAEGSKVARFIGLAFHDFKFILAGQDADARHPGQLLYGGFSKGNATLLIGIFGLIFLAGMVIWARIIPNLRRTTTMLIGLGGLAIAVVFLALVNSVADNPAYLNESNLGSVYILLPFIVAGVMLMSGFTPASLTHMGAISELMPGKRGAVMGLYSVVLGVGQLVGTLLGGVFVDAGGFYGLMVFSAILGVISLFSVLYMRSHQHDLITSGGH